MHERRLPPWLKRPVDTDRRFFTVRRKVQESGLATVCESAACPNRGECAGHGFLTVMILGDTCTRSCGFCGVRRGAPAPPDPTEPTRVAHLLSSLGLRYVVLTSVDRDDLPDGGAAHWAATLRLVRGTCPTATIEALVPDFKGSPASLDTVLSSGPDVLAHNVETVASLQERVRPQASYERSLRVLETAAARGFLTKSGFMVGLGEALHEIDATLRDLASVGVGAVTVGQYLQPRRDRLPVVRYWAPEEFDAIRDMAKAYGLQVEAGPFVRSSYRADAAHATVT